MGELLIESPHMDTVNCSLRQPDLSASPGPGDLRGAFGTQFARTTSCRSRLNETIPCRILTFAMTLPTAYSFEPLPTTPTTGNPGTIPKERSFG